MKPLEFKNWLDNCLRDARTQGLSDEDILIELLEQTRILTTKVQLKLCGGKT